MIAVISFILAFATDPLRVCYEAPPAWACFHAQDALPNQQPVWIGPESRINDSFTSET